VGSARTAANEDHAFLYNGTTMADLGTLGGDGSWAEAINDFGHVVGRSDNASGYSRAFLYDGTTMIDLNDLLPSGSGWVLTNARDINDAGQIVGSGTIGGQSHAFLMGPSAVPEPTSLAGLLGMGAMACLAYRWRKRRTVTQ
jgi:probable HAF family extracellular repeat protein